MPWKANGPSAGGTRGLPQVLLANLSYGCLCPMLLELSRCYRTSVEAVPPRSLLEASPIRPAKMLIWYS